jgi:hypothetical protein
MHLSRIALSSILIACLVALTACSKQEKASSAQHQTPPASLPAQKRTEFCYG